MFNWKVVNRGEIVTDVSYDRSKVLAIISEYEVSIREAIEKARNTIKILKKRNTYR